MSLFNLYIIIESRKWGFQVSFTLLNVLNMVKDLNQINLKNFLAKLFQGNFEMSHPIRKLNESSLLVPLHKAKNYDWKDIYRLKNITFSSEMFDFS